MSIVVQLIIGELELVEGDRLFHPVRSAGGAIGVHVYPWRRDRVGSACHNPGAAVESVPVPFVIAGYKVHHQEVLCVWLQTEQATL